jgi:type VI secretion system protein
MKAGLFDVLTGRFADGLLLADTGSEDHLVLSVISNLERIFNARRGSLVHLPDYGLPDISEIYRDMPDSVVELQQAVREVIEKYEPRLHRVRVEHQNTDPYAMRLIFLLSGELSDRRKVRFQTTFSSHETVDVRPWQQL